MSSSPHLTARQLALQARASVALHRTGSPLSTSSQPHLRRSSTQETDDSTSGRRRGAPEREYLTRAMRKERMSFFQDAGCKRDIELVGLETLEAKVKEEPESSSQDDDESEDDEDDEESEEEEEEEEEDNDEEKSDNNGADGGGNNQKGGKGDGDGKGEKELPLVMRLRDRGRRGGVDKGDKDKDKDKRQPQPPERDTPMTRRRSLSPKKTFKQPQPPRLELRFGFVSEGRHLKAKGRSPHRKKKATPRLTNAAPVVANLSQAQQPWRTESGRFASMQGIDAGVGAPRPPVAWLPTLTLPIENKRDPKPPVGDRTVNPIPPQYAPVPFKQQQPSPERPRIPSPSFLQQESHQHQQQQQHQQRHSPQQQRRKDRERERRDEGSEGERREREPQSKVHKGSPGGRRPSSPFRRAMMAETNLPRVTGADIEDKIKQYEVERIFSEVPDDWGLLALVLGFCKLGVIGGPGGGGTMKQQKAEQQVTEWIEERRRQGMEDTARDRFLNAMESAALREFQSAYLELRNFDDEFFRVVRQCADQFVSRNEEYTNPLWSHYYRTNPNIMYARKEDTLRREREWLEGGWMDLEEKVALYDNQNGVAQTRGGQREDRYRFPSLLTPREQRDRAIDSKIRHMAEIQSRLKYQLESQFAYMEQLLKSGSVPFIEFDDTHMEQMLLDTDVDVEMS
ncbi:unnamed protein product [Vitrella brassicaformis CCMP3155]|uniref:Uncharacterized protein n=2 Tax=Vitrella brassicaformis TaxID=1169539 RepID=A0A0G4FA57_VITBC|nr:unnamed protein product [Vitrella brassicaformis CCMP3155]|eukprot:CEM09176.1 unnamed protein product [Vitrella brassicaformis CCMP3155]